MTDNMKNERHLTTEKKEGQLVTRGIVNCRDSASFSVSAFNKLLCNMTEKCYEIGN